MKASVSVLTRAGVSERCSDFLAMQKYKTNGLNLKNDKLQSGNRMELSSVIQQSYECERLENNIVTKHYTETRLPTTVKGIH